MTSAHDATTVLSTTSASGPADSVNVLQTADVSIRFGGVQALKDVNLRIDQWEIVGIIGPNGAGKTTLFNCITGFYTPTSGRVRYRGQDVTELQVHERSKLGMGRTFQNVGLVKGSTAGENLKSAQHLEVSYGAFAGMFGAPKSFEIEKETEERAHAILELMGLDHLYNTRIQGLPYGIQKRLEIAAVLATDPDLLLLDEPGSGLGPEEADALGDFLLEIREKFELSITMIDHHVPLVTRVSDYMYCLNFGEVLAEGQPDDVRNHPEVVRAYLGDDPDAPPGKDYSPDVQNDSD
jgi:branched-chain amino acid transport system ATP-binding protein